MLSTNCEILPEQPGAHGRQIKMIKTYPRERQTKRKYMIFSDRIKKELCKAKLQMSCH